MTDSYLFKKKVRIIGPDLWVGGMPLSCALSIRVTLVSCGYLRTNIWSTELLFVPLNMFSCSVMQFQKMSVLVSGVSEETNVSSIKFNLNLSLMGKPEASVAIKLLKKKLGRNLTRNQTQKGTHHHLGDSR